MKFKNKFTRFLRIWFLLSLTTTVMCYGLIIGMWTFMVKPEYRGLPVPKEAWSLAAILSLFFACTIAPMFAPLFARTPPPPTPPELEHALRAVLGHQDYDRASKTLSDQGLAKLAAHHAFLGSLEGPHVDYIRAYLARKP